jgi:ribosomal protein S18 acetylase RimI-like enzyme
VEFARPATNADVPRIVELALLLRAELRELRGGDLWSRREARQAPLDAVYGALVSDSGTLVVVGGIDDAIVGYGILEIETLPDGTRHGVIGELYVEPEARQVGVGEGILDALLAHADAQQVSGVDSLALPGHRAAKNFFEGAGFTARAIVMHRGA